MLRRLGVRAPHVLFGHTHRSGPWPRDDPAEWTTAAGSRLLNTGSWVYQPHFLSGEPNASPYWPGTAVLVEDDGPPRLIRLLGDRGHRGAATPGVKQVAWQVDAGADLELEHAGGVVRVLDERVAAGRGRPRTRGPFARTSPAPSSTAHTPPASYGPE